MKRNNINWIFNNHSTERFFERTSLNSTKKQIAKAIINKQITPFKRINVTRSMTYIHVNKEIIKTVMHRKKNKIITILPWKSIYQYIIKLEITQYQSGVYTIHLFPDCYLETNKPNALTKIYRENIENIEYNHPLFNTIFNIAWYYFQLDEEHKTIQKKRITGNETFEIKRKAKTIEPIIRYGIDHCELH